MKQPGGGGEEGRSTSGESGRQARRMRVEGTVQGVGFRPHVHRLAARHGIDGWVRNVESGVEIHAEGAADAVAAFQESVQAEAPPQALIAELRVEPVPPELAGGFSVRPSDSQGQPSAQVTPDLAICRDCREELLDPGDRRYRYPYMNCTQCGPRFSIILDLPYDRHNTTMRGWELCRQCRLQYEDVSDRRFHAQPVACAGCGPGYRLQIESETWAGWEAIERAAQALGAGRILAVKGVGGYHIACDARNREAVSGLRLRKYRKEKPFALMAKDLDVASELVLLSDQARSILTSDARPVVIAPARVELPAVAPGLNELGVMLPYAPLQVLLFEAGAPQVLVMTSANRSSEPIAYRDQDAVTRLGPLVDGFLRGERPIARPVDDSVVRASGPGTTFFRRARGFAPSPICRLPVRQPVLAVGADLKNTVTLCVDGQAVMSQHLGDLTQVQCLESFREAIEDLLRLYRIPRDELVAVHDLHPEYLSTAQAHEIGKDLMAVQHHRAHIAAVLAEREAWEETIVGFAFDGAGYGQDGQIWGGEVFLGSLRQGLERVAHLNPVPLPGGDAAARFPLQAAAGFLSRLPDLPDLFAPPFSFGENFRMASRLVENDTRCFRTTSVGRLFDAVAALLGFTREVTFEGQAAIWLEQLARGADPGLELPFPELDSRPLLAAVIEERKAGRPGEEIARAFHEAVCKAVVDMALDLCGRHRCSTVVLSGGVFQNRILLEGIDAGWKARAGQNRLWTHRLVPPNDGGISLGQAAVAAASLRWPSGN